MEGAAAAHEPHHTPGDGHADPVAAAGVAAVAIDSDPDLNGQFRRACRCDRDS